MQFTPLEIPDVKLIEPRLFKDDRGFFFESYRKSIFAQAGITEDFDQDNHVRSCLGALRGLHYQLEPYGQAKMVRVIQGEIFDVAVDIRKSSPTFGKWVGVYLNAVERKMLYIPKGFAHGYLALTEGAEVLYKVSNTYSPEHERGVIWNDPSIGIEWPEIEGRYTFSEKDQKYPALAQAEVYA